MKTKHTPGPWAVERDGDTMYVNFDAGTIARVGPCGKPDKEDEANASLIAAAPDLLVALEAVLKGVATPVSDHPWAVKQRRAHALARAAIAKAKAIST